MHTSLRGLPTFSPDGYATLVEALLGVGYKIMSAGTIAVPTDQPTVYLRHDVDLHLARVDEIAQIEADAGVQATYYIPLTQHFNVLNRDSIEVLEKILKLGHELGLHYDLTRYPSDHWHAQRHLAWEISTLEHATGAAVGTICMHEPHRGQTDLFRTGTRWTNPHDPAFGDSLVYISDSCRAWRDETLLECFGPHRPSRVLLNTHPELWMDGSIVNRNAYLESVVITNSTLPMKRYLLDTVRSAWSKHDGAISHDARSAKEISA